MTGSFRASWRRRGQLLLAGVTTDDLRTTAGVRARVQQGMAEIATELDTMIVKKPGRKFRFEAD